MYNKEDKIIFYYEDDVLKMLNILIYNIIRNDGKKISIIVSEANKRYLNSQLEMKNVFISNEVTILNENDFMKHKDDSEVYILMYSHLLNYYKEIIGKIRESKCIVIGKRDEDLNTTNSDTLGLLEENDRLLRYRQKWEKIKFINDEEVKFWIVDTIEIAKKNIFIECPWFNKEAFEFYKNPILKAINRGVDVRIKYGIMCETDARYGKTEEVITSLELQVGSVKNLKLIKGNTHKAKALIDKFYLFSSLNYCSNDMKYNNSPDEEATVNVLNNKEEFLKKYNEFEVNMNDLSIT